MSSAKQTIVAILIFAFVTTLFAVLCCVSPNLKSAWKVDKVLEYYRSTERFTNKGDGTIFDTKTNLLWQQESPNVKLTWGGAKEYCESLTLAGHSDWRLPTKEELESLIDKGYKSAINPIFKSLSGWHWSSSIGVVDPHDPWDDSLFDGIVSFGDEDGGGFVRAVQGGTQESVNIELKVIGNELGLIDKGDGTIFDANTNLLWQQISSGEKRTWRESNRYCKSLTLGGHNDWRLPTKEELESLIDKKYYPTINPIFNCWDKMYWSSSVNINDSSYVWYVDFCRGLVYLDDENIKCLTRAVRG